MSREYILVAGNKSPDLWGGLPCFHLSTAVWVHVWCAHVRYGRQYGTLAVCTSHLGPPYGSFGKYRSWQELAGVGGS